MCCCQHSYGVCECRKGSVRLAGSICLRHLSLRTLMWDGTFACCRCTDLQDWYLETANGPHTMASYPKSQSFSCISEASAAGVWAVVFA